MVMPSLVAEEVKMQANPEILQHLPKPEAWLSANVETQLEPIKVCEKDLIDEIDLFYHLPMITKSEEEEAKEIPYHDYLEQKQMSLQAATAAFEHKYSKFSEEIRLKVIKKQEEKLRKKKLKEQ
jgi:hypothetical protein